MPKSRYAHTHGLAAEDAVSRALEDRGYGIVARNWSCAHGEIDIIAQQESGLYFVEVKSRKEGDVSGVESLTLSKQRKLSKTADMFLSTWQEPFLHTSFVVALVEQSSTGAFAITWIDDAFDAEEAS